MIELARNRKQSADALSQAVTKKRQNIAAQSQYFGSINKEALTKLGKETVPDFDKLLENSQLWIG